MRTFARRRRWRDDGDVKAIVAMALRVGLELWLYAGFVELGRHWSGLWLGIALAIVPALAWELLQVPGDPAREGKPVRFAIGGVMRLGLELGLFAAATAAWVVSHGWKLALPFAAVTVVHYVLSSARVKWLLR